jgi:hypothetical protein
LTIENSIKEFEDNIAVGVSVRRKQELESDIKELEEQITIQTAAKSSAALYDLNKTKDDLEASLQIAENSLQVTENSLRSTLNDSCNVYTTVDKELDDTDSIMCSIVAAIEVDETLLHEKMRQLEIIQTEIVCVCYSFMTF